MYTQCTTCQTVFRITMEQLQAHNGLVRCGHCDTVFNADQQLFDDIPPVQQEPEEKPSAPKKRSTRRKSETKRAQKPRTKGTRPKEPIAAAPEPPSPLAREPSSLDPRTPPLIYTRRRSRTESLWWSFGAVVLTFAFFGQIGYFYRHELLSHPQLRPSLIQLCEKLGCRLPPLSDVARIELIQPTSIAPHPKFANVLRLRATMVNRAAMAQAFPLMEVTLTDSQGRILARRTFTPQEYLEPPADVDAPMPPHVAVATLLDITNPEDKAAGYEINFVAAPDR